ncbi:MAG: hypothetical protein WCF85_19000 [Rhodospirillaceae bacterium]
MTITLNRMLEIGAISSEQHDAGIKLVSSWHQRRQTARRAVMALPTCCALTWSLIETIVGDGLIPPRLDTGHPLGQVGWAIGARSLSDGFDAIGVTGRSG